MNGSADLIASTLKMCVALAALLGGMWGLLHMLRRLQKGKWSGGEGQLIRVLANRYLGPKKYISLVEVAGVLLVLGITGEQISLLARLDSRDVPEEAGLPAEVERTGAFAGLLQRFFSSADATEGGGNGSGK